MTERRDKRGHFIKGNVPWNKKRDSPQREMNSLVAPEVIGGEVLKPWTAMDGLKGTAQLLSSSWTLKLKHSKFK